MATRNENLQPYLLEPAVMVLMSPDFWAGWVSGAFGVMIGNSMDKQKVHLQAQSASSSHLTASIIASVPSSSLRSLRTSSSSPLSLIIKHVQAKAPLAETAAPMLGYGLLNGILFWAYNWTEDALNTALLPSPSPSSTLSHQYTVGSTTGSNLWTTWLAGAAGGLLIWPVSTPTELIKCRAQLASARGTDASNQTSSAPSSSSARTSSLRSRITQAILRSQGISIMRTERMWGLYRGGVVTALRDSIGYGFYFWAYALGDRIMTSLLRQTSPSPTIDGIDSASNNASSMASFSREAAKVVLCGGVAGVVSFVSIFPLDVIKTCIQSQVHPTGTLPLGSSIPRRKGAIQLAREIYKNGGTRGFFPGLIVCSKRAFIVNAIQWPIYKGFIFWLSPSNLDREKESHL